eukprot:m.76474 g.76474  ORF g.76474 m.76474 type:complete len:119 (+) comp7871_c0_seq7:1220-1576(+)
MMATLAVTAPARPRVMRPTASPTRALPLPHTAILAGMAPPCTRLVVLSTNNSLAPPSPLCPRPTPRVILRVILRANLPAALHRHRALRLPGGWLSLVTPLQHRMSLGLGRPDLVRQWR